MSTCQPCPTRAHMPRHRQTSINPLRMQTYRYLFIYVFLYNRQLCQRQRRNILNMDNPKVALQIDLFLTPRYIHCPLAFRVLNRPIPRTHHEFNTVKQYKN